MSELQYPPAVTEVKQMRDAVAEWHQRLSDESPAALGGADKDQFAAAVSVVHSRTYGGDAQFMIVYLHIGRCTRYYVIFS